MKREVLVVAEVPGRGHVLGGKGHRSLQGTVSAPDLKRRRLHRREEQGGKPCPDPVPVPVPSKDPGQDGPTNRQVLCYALKPGSSRARRPLQPSEAGSAAPAPRAAGSREEPRPWAPRPRCGRARQAGPSPCKALHEGEERGALEPARAGSTPSPKAGPAPHPAATGTSNPRQPPVRSRAPRSMQKHAG